MTKIISLTNQKGGVGKTTSTIAIAYELAQTGRKVLIVDFDPQCSATSGIGAQLIDGTPDVYDMFFGKASLSSIVTPTKYENVWIAPSSKDLVGVEIEIGKAAGRELILRSQISGLNQSFDYVLIDCPPSVGLLTLNALGASESVLIPLQAEYYALEGISALMNTLQFVQQTFNPSIHTLGVFMTMFDARTNLSNQVEGEAKKYFTDLMFTSRIPRNIKLSECPSFGMPIGAYDPISSGAVAYRALSKEIDIRCYGEKSVQIAANS